MERKNPTEFGIVRGIDFKNVATVINFDLPPSITNYTHRIGRTARAGKVGAALTFIDDTNVEISNFGKLLEARREDGHDILPYKFSLDAISGLSYRVEDAVKRLSPLAVKRARLADLRHEILNSEKLKQHYDQYGNDIEYLRNNNGRFSKEIDAPSSLKYLPSYLLPAEMQPAQTKRISAHIKLKAFDPLDSEAAKKKMRSKKARTLKASKMKHMAKTANKPHKS
eukprot:TRINITY_DN4228_c0_g1_i7.p1 TRINITY_DN4228_c0_g1~~TRINITY_DN4228_c0_g1_i7.p1  ORF type:complete len:225 (-),score=89.17 TRINITY_DN4228_c0_g1_i7:21-695(-)